LVPEGYFYPYSANLSLLIGLLQAQTYFKRSDKTLLKKRIKNLIVSTDNFNPKPAKDEKYNFNSAKNPTAWECSNYVETLEEPLKIELIEFLGRAWISPWVLPITSPEDELVVLETLLRKLPSNQQIVQTCRYLSLSSNEKVRLFASEKGLHNLAKKI